MSRPDHRAVINEKTIADFKRVVEQTSILQQEPNRLIAPTPPIEGAFWCVEFPQFEGYIGRMVDEWNEQLRCPNCGKTGIASLSQSEGERTPTVQSVSDGFKVVQTQHGPNLQCETCNVSVDP
jgi:hypothetical protein